MPRRRSGAVEPPRACRHRPGLLAVGAPIAAMEAGERLALARHLRPRRVPSEAPPAPAVAERRGQRDAAALRELGQRWRARLPLEPVQA